MLGTSCEYTPTTAKPFTIARSMPGLRLPLSSLVLGGAKGGFFATGGDSGEEGC